LIEPILLLDIIATSCLLLDPLGVSVEGYKRDVFNWISSLLEREPLCAIDWLNSVIISITIIEYILMYWGYYLS
jgi:hypothetical protein